MHALICLQSGSHTSWHSIVYESIYAIQEKKDMLHIGDVQLRLTPLEEVFMAVAREAEMKHAEHMHQTTELVLNGGTVLQASALAVGRQY